MEWTKNVFSVHPIIYSWPSSYSPLYLVKGGSWPWQPNFIISCISCLSAGSANEGHWWEFGKLEQGRSLSVSFPSSLLQVANLATTCLFITPASTRQSSHAPSYHQENCSPQIPVTHFFTLSCQSRAYGSFLLLLIPGLTQHPLLLSLLLHHLCNQVFSLYSSCCKYLETFPFFLVEYQLTNNSILWV